MVLTHIVPQKLFHLKHYGLIAGNNSTLPLDGFTASRSPRPTAITAALNTSILPFCLRLSKRGVAARLAPDYRLSLIAWRMAIGIVAQPAVGPEYQPLHGSNVVATISSSSRPLTAPFHATIATRQRLKRPQPQPDESGQPRLPTIRSPSRWAAQSRRKLLSPVSLVPGYTWSVPHGRPSGRTVFQHHPPVTAPVGKGCHHTLPMFRAFHGVRPERRECGQAAGLPPRSNPTMQGP